MLDFTLNSYTTLIKALLSKGFLFKTFAEYLEKPGNMTIVLRHDVDRFPENSLVFATIQTNIGLKGTYYFRATPESWNEAIIRKIAAMGHEVGYHYEDLSFAWAKLKAQGTGRRAQGEELEKLVVDIGIESFERNLEKLRKIVPVKTICMHGSPMSRWDSRLLWKYYDYRDFGIIGEPYFDIDFNEVLYLTDTGRRWDGDLVSIRDKAQGTGHREQGLDKFKDWKVKPKEIDSLIPHNSHLTPLPKFHSTFDIIRAAEEGKLPDKIMMTFHPQRWTDKPIPWVKELVWQNVKNAVKYFIVRM
jgi:hypothetical protein